MVADLVSPIMDFVGSYGLPAILLFIILDSAMLLPVFPGELLFVMAAQQYADTYGELAWLTVIITAASTFGCFLLYLFARLVSDLGDRHPRLALMSPKRKKKWEETFRKPSGQSLVFFLRIVPFTRIIVNIPAGLAKMPSIRFLILTFLGNLVSIGAFMLISYEANVPGSTIHAQTVAFQDNLVDPALAFVKTNWLLVSGVAIVLGIVLSLRASAKSKRNPTEGMEGSLLGMLAVMTLFWGGLGMIALLWVDPVFLYDSIALSGWDLRTAATGLPFEPMSLAILMGVAALLLALAVNSARRAARRKVRLVRKIQRDHMIRPGRTAHEETLVGRHRP